ncbi:M20/M25/M40 family metallo-hydrolase [Crassaminicella thermophila]|uniref:M20/M25/M40 family metallo-hydrolase n=1 Tax=Crassaminicella thermophila TaxID=2599308 RepID=A0A5C0SC34_CRATE|nr:M20/M25/M40 family metallo-hydrolase [Crassaminicella thermophila]QEK11721.1 M20/M25/M40 family metallo-hydrolase [Crassaminicella thermophila]
MFEKLNNLAAELKPQAVEFCQRLIRTPAISGDEKEVADLYLAEMEKLGYDEVFRDEWGNVVGIIKGDEPGPTIMYNSHLDHVDPGDISEWEGYDPYGAEIDVVDVENQDRTGLEKAEVIHGRAAADVKGGGATQIYAGYALIKLREMGYKLKGNFMFTGVVLEEPAEQLGMIKLLDETFPKRGLDYDGVVSSEATSLKLYLGHRGRVELKVTISGVTSHGSAPWLGINAVNKATKFIDRVEEVVAQNAGTDKDLGKSSIALTIINCTPGALCIVPDRAHITYDRRFVPGETAESCLKEIQGVIDELSAQDPDFRATVEIAAVPRTSYTGKTATVPNIKQAWKIDKEHPFVKAAADAIDSIGDPVKYGYWDFGTDLSVICGRDKKPAIGYSPMQEIYCHRPIDKVRIDYMERSIAGNASIFLKLVDLPKESFKLE